ncbi:hypothetical protein EVAR_32734_1 [Eumeta japonica]|uniref:Uncharacterized protein n=1 Tax=Eumeta variegata TaxID=151549 RepID=A0A4C1XKZ7_EUMVA|nr:hypothetical protein EVAR_32734_1 [Eumeta japonica]
MAKGGGLATSGSSGRDRYAQKLPRLKVDNGSSGHKFLKPLLNIDVARSLVKVPVHWRQTGLRYAAASHRVHILDVRFIAIRPTVLGVYLFRLGSEIRWTLKKRLRQFIYAIAQKA